MPRPYTPIDCGLHDELQLLVMRGREVEVSVRTEGPDAPPRTVCARLTDVFARDGVEYLRLATGEDVRLDDLVAVDGRPFTRAR